MPLCRKLLIIAHYCIAMLYELTIRITCASGNANNRLLNIPKYEAVSRFEIDEKKQLWHEFPLKNGYYAEN